MTRFSAYLAGPGVFDADPVRLGERLKAICERHHVEGHFPLDNVLSDPNSRNLAKKIADANEAAIRKCDVIVADMVRFRGPSMDPGTSYEMGFAKALRKPIFAYVPDGSSYLQRVSHAMPVTLSEDGAWRDGDGMSVENFDGLVDNLMMVCSATTISKSFEEAVRSAVAYMSFYGRGVSAPF